MDITKILAKSSTNDCNRFLVNHTKMAINFGMRIGECIYNGDTGEKSDFLMKLSLSLLLHDIGKITNSFQSYIRNYQIDEEGLENASPSICYQHHVYSWAYAASRLNGLSKSKNQCILSSILFHHTCNNIDIFSNAVLDSLSHDELSTMDEFYLYMLEYCRNVFNIKYSDDYDIVVNSSDYNMKCINETNIYDRIVLNENTNREKAFENDSNTQLIRSIVILSDRLISSGQCNLNYIFDNNISYIDGLFMKMSKCDLLENIDLYNFDFDKHRLDKQYNLLERTINYNHNVIKASAGFGKTIIGLMWFFKWKKRLLWITPRNIIASGTYKSILKELSKMGLVERLKIGVYFDGHLIEKNCNTVELDDFDILITNIDSIVSRTTNNSMAHLLVNMYTSNIIFDEYHEFKMHEGIFSSFIRLMHIRSRYTHSKTLLLSATASNFDVLWGSNIVNYINDTDILYGDTKISIKYKEFNKKENAIKLQFTSKDTFVICHTVPQSQNIFTCNEKEGMMLLHARFTTDDRVSKTNKVLQTHGSPNDGCDISKRNPVIGTNYIGTGLDISCKALHDFVISPETTIQRCCGRCSRFGEYEKIEYNVCVFNGKIDKIIDDDYDSSLYLKWINELKKLDGCIITKSELYSLYEQFYKVNRNNVERYYISLFNESSNSLNYIKLRSKPKKVTNKKYLSTDYGYRGFNNSIFVTAKDKFGNWCNPFPIDYDIIFNPRSSKRESDSNRNMRKEMIKHNHPDMFKYPSAAVLKYKYGIADFSNEECARIAKCEDSPLPLFDFHYDSILGLKFND